MPPIVLTISLLLALSGCDQPEEGGHQNKKTAQANSVWNRYDLYEDRAAQLISPNSHLMLNYHDGIVGISRSEGDDLRLDLNPPASVLWRPDGKWLAINDGNGSGQRSNLIVIGDNLARMYDVEKKAKSYFFQHTGCRSDPTAVSVSAEGWSVDSLRLWVRFESWDRQVLCDADLVSFAQYDVVHGRVVSHLSLSQALNVFCQDAEFRKFFGPNCSQHKREVHKGSVYGKS